MKQNLSLNAILILATIEAYNYPDQIMFEFFDTFAFDKINFTEQELVDALGELTENGFIDYL